MKPRPGGGAVITSSASPASGSTSRCIRPGFAIGTVTLARAGSVMLRIAFSGCDGVCMASAKVSTQFCPVFSSPVSDASCGRLSRRRIAWPFSSGTALTSPITDPASRRIGSRSSGFAESNTSHTTSARRNKAAGAAEANENVRRSPSLLRLASDRIDGGCRLGFRRRLGGRRARFSAAARQQPRAGVSLAMAGSRRGRDRRVPRLAASSQAPAASRLRLGLKPGLLRDRLRGRRHDLAGTLRRRLVGRLVATGLAAVGAAGATSGEGFSDWKPISTM